MAGLKLSLTRRVDLSHVSKRGLPERIWELGFPGKINSQSKKLGVEDDYDVMEFDECAGLPLQKKRKISPIVWDGESDGEGVTKGFGKSLLMEEDDWEPGQIDEEDFSHAHSIRTTRWAVDDTLEECEIRGRVVNGEELKMRSSNPESGVTQRDGSDGSWNKSTGSDGERLPMDYMDLDNGRDEIESESDSDSDSDCERGDPVSRKRNMLMGCRSVYEFERLGRISEGSYGIVHKAWDKKSGEIVALKKLKMNKDGGEGFPIHYLREINTLLALNHDSIVNVREVVVDDSARNGFDNIFLSMDYVKHDMKELMKSRTQPFSQSEVKDLMLQLLKGVHYLHENWIIHRDLKTANLLVTENGELKICDFGMARQYSSPLKPYTSLVVTLWYRAPELLLGETEYSTAVDMWSVGCIMAELLNKKPLFDGETETEQINKIFKMLGTPNVNNWPNYSKLPGSKLKYVHQPHNLLRKQFPRPMFTGSPVLSDLGLDLLSRLLSCDPEKRITAQEAIGHSWFKEHPLPNMKESIHTFTI